MNTVVVGGGNLGHAIAVTVSKNCNSVGMLTRDGSGFGAAMEARLPSGDVVRAENVMVSDRAADLIPQADIVILTVPAHAVEKCLKSIQPFVSDDQRIGSVVASGGFFWIARGVLDRKVGLFAFQRVPFICRVVRRGALVEITGLKEELYLAQLGCLPTDPRYRAMIAVFERCFRTRITPLASYLEATISNSNPILHTCRLYSLLGQRHLCAPLYFYRDWDVDSSRMLLACDEEVRRIIDGLPVDFPLFKPLKRHYGVEDAVSLTEKLSSIKAFESITFPLEKRDNGHEVLDGAHRYFVEDVPFGLVVLRALAQIVGVETPNMDRVIRGLQAFLGRKYLTDRGSLDGRDIGKSGIPQNFGIDTIEELVRLQ